MQPESVHFFSLMPLIPWVPLDPLELVYPKELPLFDKYDEYLPEALVKKGFAQGVLDLDGLREAVLGWETAQ